jgi:hypothetical protein
VTTLRTAASALFCAALTGAPRLALACSVCTAGREDETQTAFLVTTIFLSLLPLSMFAGFGFWLWRRYRIQQRELGERLQERPAPIDAELEPGR